MHRKSIAKRASVIAALTLLSSSFLAATAQVSVKTASGTLEGSAEKGVYAFKGVPYAAPPIGDLRWRSPQPVTGWAGVRKAQEFGPSCMQYKSGERLPWTTEFMVQNKISEDCLYLNIWTPKLNSTAKLPVILFIHGGGYVEGSAAVDVYAGENLAAKGALVVTINYRLGVFGFLAHPELTAESGHHSSGDYAVQDQIAALQWVNQNIAPFGGDPRNITIWGQSAGAGSVANLIASPLAAGLFEHAQGDSGFGIAGLPVTPFNAAEANGVKFAEEHHAGSIKELRAVSAADLIGDPSQASPSAGFRFGPIVEGWILPDTPNNMNEKGSDNDVPVITGYQAGDAALFTPKLESLDAYHQYVQKRYGASASEFEKLYPVRNMEDLKSAISLSGQERDRVSMYLWASARAKSHHTPVYTYYFDRGIPWPQHPEFGAFHTGEIPYFFLNLKVLDRPWERIDSDLAAEVSSYLLNFSKKGDPNGTGLPHWPRINSQEPQTMELGVRSGPMPLADKAKLEFWVNYFNSPSGKNASPF